MILPIELQQPIEYVAGKVNADPADLARLIWFESRFDPLAANPRSSAKGLIQFIDDTARWLGYEDSQDLIDRFPTFDGQMRGPVLEYLQRYGPYKNTQQLYMAVFYPAARSWEPDRVFPQWVIDANTDPATGEEIIRTPADYINLVDRSADIVLNAAGPIATGVDNLIRDPKKIALVLLLAGGAAWLLLSQSS